MTTRKNSLARWSSMAGLLTVACLAGSLSAQNQPRHVGLPDDWSHRHLIFSNPGTYEQTAGAGSFAGEAVELARRPAGHPVQDAAGEAQPRHVLLRGGDSTPDMHRCRIASRSRPRTPASPTRPSSASARRQASGKDETAGDAAGLECEPRRRHRQRICIRQSSPSTSTGLRTARRTLSCSRLATSRSSGSRRSSSPSTTCTGLDSAAQRRLPPSSSRT